MRQLFLLLLLCLLNFTAFSQKDQRLGQGLLPINQVPVALMPSQNNAQLLAEEEARSGPGVAPRFAVNIPVEINPTTDGLWEYTADGAVWRLRIHSPGAESINLGFTSYFMPKGGKLMLYSPDYQEVRGPFTPADNEEHEQLWTPILEGDELVIEVQLPVASVEQLKLQLAYVNHAFKSFSSLLSGSCNLDVICGAADGWGIVDPHRDIIQSVAVISTGGGTFCTGFLVNNVQQDCAPFFMTANHCGINAGNAPSLVTYWNYQNSFCRPPNSGASGGNGDGQLNDFNTGSIFRASRSASDFVLVELDDPISPTANAYLAGWDATGNNISSAIGVHHPGTDEKRISFENDPTQFTTYGGGSPTPNYTHVRVIDWDVGTTEGGSSGSPLFDQNERVVGQLHGGGAACGNNLSDWYGSFAISWDAGSSASSRLRDWLDPANTGTTVIDGRWANDCSFILTAAPVTQTVCQPLSATYSIQASNAFTSNVSFSLSGAPSGASFNFSPASVPPGGTTTLSIQTNNVDPGTYSFTVTGNASGNSGEVSLSLTVLAGSQGTTSLLDPANNSTGIFPNPVLSWDGDDSGATTYEVQLSTNSSFTNIIETGISTSTFYQPVNANMGLTTYYWRVRASNDCGTGSFSTGWSFVTQNVNCVTYESDFTSTISEVGSPSIDNDIFIGDNFTIADVSVMVDLTHTYIGDLDARLLPASGGSIMLFDRPGFPNSNFGCSQDNLLVSFNANSPNSSTALENTCNSSDTGPNNPGPPYAISGSYQPIGNLAGLANQNSSGLWTLEVNDNEAADGGILESWSITICYEVLNAPPELVVNNVLPVPYNQGETITDAYLLAEDSESSTDELVYRLNSVPGEGDLLFDGQVLNVNNTFTQADINNSLISYTHNGGNVLNDAFDFDLTNDAGLSVNDNTFLIEIIVETLIASITPTNDILCNGGNDGALEATAEGGVPPYSYRLNGGPFQDESIFTSLEAGSYSVIVVDDLGTIAGTNTITISQPDILSASTTVQEDQVTVNTQGGTPGYTYQLNGGTAQSSNVFNSLENGDYIITVVDANGCSTTTSATITVNTLTIDAELTDTIDCFNDNDAVITITATGGTSPLQYRLNSGPLQDSPLFENLPAGTYIPEVVDSEGFTRQTTAININNPAELTASLDVDMRTILVSAAGGTPPLQYQLGSNNPQNSNVFTDVANGTYSIQVIDANGCNVSLSAMVSVNTLVISAALTQALDCFNDNDAVITITATGGTSPLQYRLNSGPLQDSPVFGNLPAGTYTPEVVDSEGFTRQTTAININNPAELTASLDVDMRTISVSAAGGTPPLQYQLGSNNPQNSNVFTDVANGTYSIQVIDANGCNVSLSAMVSVNTLVISAALTQALDCFNDNDAVITITATGGTSPLQYRLNGGPLQDSPVFGNLPAGTYTPEVVDSEGFTRQTTAITINNPAELTASLDVDMSTISVSAAGGTPPLQYQLGSNNPQNSNVFTDVANGTYSIQIIDANGCNVSLSAMVSVNTLVISAALTQALDCFNDNDAVITITATGGTSPLQYRLNGGPLQDSPVFGNLPAGTYTPEVVDSEGFTRQTTAITINNPAELTANVVVFMNNIIVSATGGTPPLQYQLNENSPQSSNVFTEVANGTYIVRVIDANGCSQTLSATVLINNMMVTTSITSVVSCTGVNDASIGVNVMGGTPPFFYSLNNGPFVENPNFTELGIGEYTVTVQDANDFFETSNTVNIENPAPLLMNVILEEADLTIDASGGTEPLEYSLDGMNWTDTSIFLDLPDGIYQISVRDANGCAVVNEVIIAVNSILASVELLDEVSCLGEQDASLMIEVEGGIAPYRYSLDGMNFQDSNLFTDLGAGVYNVVIEDQIGAVFNTAFTISEPPLLSLSLDVADNLITALAEGGVPPYSYQLNGGSPQDDPSFLDLAVGDYEITVTDANACTSSQVASILVGLFDLPDNNWSVQLYPNPNRGQFQLKLSETIEQELQLYIYNAAGQLVTHQTRSAMEASRPMYFDLPSYAAGVYQIVITDGNKVSVIRLVVE